jgi:hypothetical protein
VRGVEIPKDHGEGVRLPGVTDTADRVAQTAAAMLLEQVLEPVFHRDSYGYRPGRSAHDALAGCRRRCWAQDWVLDLDVRAFSGLRSAFPLAESGRSPHQRAVGPAVYLAVAESAGADAGRDHCAEGEGNPAGQYCLVKHLGVSLLTFPQRHAREFVDDLLIQPPCFHFPCCSDIFPPWAKPGLVWR